MADVVVIGAGISGAATAYELAKAGLDVVVLDRYGPAAMASGWTLAGVRQSGRDPAELPLARAAVEIWGTLAERLDAPTHYTRRGNLRLARTDEELASVAAIVEEQSGAGLGIELLQDHAAVRAVAPAIAPHIIGASFCATDGHADPVATVQAYIDAAVREGTTMRFGERVTAIDVADGKVIGVSTDRDRIPAGRVVLAAGIFCNDLLRPVGREVPLSIRMVTLVRTEPMAPVLEQVIGVANAECAGRQEVGGRFRYTSGICDWHGGLQDGARPRVRPWPGDIAQTIRLFGELVPAVTQAPVDEIWAGLIDQTPDALPVLQRLDDPQGLAVAFGFSGHGFCLGPITGRIMARLVQEQPIDLDLEPFRIERFAVWNAAAARVTLHG